MQITYGDRFVDECSPAAVRGRFCFTADGTKAAGGFDVNMKLSADRAADATKAAKIVAKRAGTDQVVLHRLTSPTR